MFGRLDPIYCSNIQLQQHIDEDLSSTGNPPRPQVPWRPDTLILDWTCHQHCDLAARPVAPLWSTLIG